MPDLDNEFAKHVNTLAKKDGFNRDADMAMHAAIGVSGEAGELLDIIKKNWAYNKPIDIPHVIEELGDIEFYMFALRAKLCISREQTLTHNIEKLKKRYPEGYTDAAAKERADKP